MKLNKILLVFTVLFVPLCTQAGGIKGGVLTPLIIGIVIITAVVVPFLYFYSIALALKSYKKKNKEKSLLAVVLGCLCLVFFLMSDFSKEMYQEQFAVILFILLIPCLITFGLMLRLFMKIPEIIDNEENYLNDEC